MRNMFFLVLILGLTGCSNNPSENTSVENSPCACVYFGEQLQTTPTAEDLKKIAELQFSEVV